MFKVMAFNIFYSSQSLISENHMNSSQHLAIFATIFMTCIFCKSIKASKKQLKKQLIEASLKKNDDFLNFISCGKSKSLEKLSDHDKRNYYKEILDKNKAIKAIADKNKKIKKNQKNDTNILIKNNNHFELKSPCKKKKLVSPKIKTRKRKNKHSELKPKNKHRSKLHEKIEYWLNDWLAEEITNLNNEYQTSFLKTKHKIGKPKQHEKHSSCKKNFTKNIYLSDDYTNFKPGILV